MATLPLVKPSLPLTTADLRTLALDTLGISLASIRASAPISSQLRMLVKPLRKRNLPCSPYYYLKCSPSPDAKRIIELYYSLPANQRNLVPIEAYCLAAKVPAQTVLDLIARSAAQLSRQASAMLAAITHPQVVEKTVECALGDDGFEDRQTLHKAVGFLPTPKGSQTNISLTQNALANAASSAAPPPEDTIRRIHNRFNDARSTTPALPADTGSLHIPDGIINATEDAIPAEIVSTEEEEEAEMSD